MISNNAYRDMQVGIVVFCLTLNTLSATASCRLERCRIYLPFCPAICQRWFRRAHDGSAVRTKSIPCVKRPLVRTGQEEIQRGAHEGVWCAQNRPRAHGDVPRHPVVPRACGSVGEFDGLCRVCKSHSHRTAHGRSRTAEVGEESVKNTPTFSSEAPQNATGAWCP